MPEKHHNIAELLLDVTVHLRSLFNDFELNSREARICENLAYACSYLGEVFPKFEELAPVHISRFSKSIHDEIKNTLLGGKSRFESIERLYAFVYPIYLEADLATPKDFPRNIQNFLAFGRQEDNFPPHISNWLRHTERWLPLEATKRLLWSEDIQNSREAVTRIQAIEAQLTQWEESLNQRESRVSNLDKRLRDQEEAFSFVALYQGFSSLAKAKTDELATASKWVIGLGVAALIPSLCFIGFALHTGLSSATNVSHVLTIALPSLAWTFITLYYLRVALKQHSGLKSQLLQIELRKSLCQFVQGYAEFAVQTTEQAPETMKKFESIIFSNIVPSEEKVPSTFDGMEHIAALVKASRSS